MTPELKAKWIAALRSGQYKQSEGQLRHRGKYCCLGVLCVVADMPIDPDGVKVLTGDGEDGYWAIHELFGEHGETVAHALWRKNDQGEPFADIADWIEANL